MFAASYIRTASAIFNDYRLQAPLAVYLKQYFKAHPKFGGRDRRYIASLLYGVYRLGKQDHVALRDKMIAGCFLSENMPDSFYEKVAPELLDALHLSFSAKRKLIESRYGITLSLPYSLSGSITEDAYFHYLFRESKVFVRIRKQFDKIIQLLQQKEIAYEIIQENCIALPLNTRVQDILPQADSYVIQDLASQMCGSFFNPKAGELWWDCCAASGGKSLLLLDNNTAIQLLMSDIRPSIIQHLHERMKRYGFTQYRAQVMDVSKPQNFPEFFDHIIADLPCSGAGTWSRNPEQFYFFDAQKLSAFHRQQSNILRNVLQQLKTGGKLYYLTCSVFALENESVIETVDQAQYQVSKFTLLNAFPFGGDCLFFCEIIRR